MFVTLVGPQHNGPLRALVGSPSLADEMLGTSSRFALADVYDSLARDLAAAGLDVRRNPLVHRPVLGQAVTLQWIRDRARRPGGEAFAQAAGDLVAAGADDLTRVTVRDWHHITWNNCLVEDSVSVGRHVYLPTYGHGDSADLAVVDEHMRHLWEDLGFEVHLLGDFNPFAVRQGVVHCLKKYLGRGD